ncbi:MAG: sulfatase-like hydrolase/transferase, partial [Sphingobacteriales bacterium]
VFLNVIFIIYLSIDIVSVTSKLIASSANKNTAVVASSKLCDTCLKPSVYFILMDEYFGSIGLKDYFNYNNSGFENQLRQKGFTVITNSRSNYHFTIYSMSSILNMDYINDLGEQTVYNQYGYYKAMLGIRQNEVCRIFEDKGYEIVNYSDFDIERHPAGLGYNLLPSQRSLISNRNMYYQVKKNLPYFLAHDAKIARFANDLDSRNIWINELRLSKTLKDAIQMKQPVFSYLHLNMPHVPYAYDSSGNNVLNKWYGNLSQQQRDSMYLQYLVYTNKRIISFVDSLQRVTNNKSVIILASDHGYRNAYVKKFVLAYQNFFAIYEPVAHKSFQRDSITSVNTFRLLFNDLFNKQYPLLKDSLVIK